MFARLRLLLLFFSLIAFIISILLVREPAEAEEVTERFPIMKDGCWVLLPIVIKGKHYCFVLDTGMSYTTYDRSIWHLLGKAMALEKIGSKDETRTVPFFQPPDARLGKLTLPKDFWVRGWDLRESFEDTVKDIDGILGMDFLKRHIFRIDFDHGEVVFLRRVGADPGQRFSTRLGDGRSEVRIDLPGLREAEWFMLDTGWARGGGGFGGSVRKSIFDALTKSGRLTSIEKRSFARLTGRKTYRFGFLDSFSFAGDTYKALWFREGESSILGLDVLSRYIVTFDFPHQAIYLKKGRSFDRPFRYDHSGLDVRRVKGQTVVVSVADGSAAAKAGILPGDVLLQIDKEQVNGMPFFTLRNLLSEDGKKFHLTVRRDTQQLDIPLVLTTHQ